MNTAVASLLLCVLLAVDIGISLMSCLTWFITQSRSSDEPGKGLAGCQVLSPVFTGSHQPKSPFMPTRNSIRKLQGALQPAPSKSRGDEGTANLLPSSIMF